MESPIASRGRFVAATVLLLYLGMHRFCYSLFVYVLPVDVCFMLEGRVGSEYMGLDGIWYDVLV